MPEGSKETRVAIVSGAAQGIGFAIAARLAGDGWFVALADRDQPGGNAAAERLGAGRAKFFPCDIADERQAESLFDAAAMHGGIHAVVNNAGIIRDKMIWNMSADEFDAVIRVNLRGTWLMCRRAAIAMRAQNAGAIVNIASRAWLGNPGQTNYAASKAGVVGLTRTLALELGSHHVRVNAVAPGLIDTPMVQGMPQEARARLIAAQPTRTMGTPADVADAVAFLVSDSSRFITGQVIYVDGGKSIGAGI